MNTIKKFSKIALPALLGLTLVTGCTGDFLEMNRNPAGVTDEQANADYNLISSFLKQAQRAVIPEDLGTYQLVANLASDGWSGYLASQTPFRGNSNNLTYELVDGWNASTWTYRYINAMNPTEKVIEMAKTRPEFKDLEALSLIIRVSAMSRVSDKIGPIIYSKYNHQENDGSILYDTQKDVYTSFFSDLEKAIEILKGLKGSAVSAQMQKSDVAYSSNNYDNWLRYANTLRLRLAIRVSYIEPALAKTQGEAALNPANGGLIENNSQNCLIGMSVMHPLNTIASPTDWSDTRMGAQMESILGGYNDPRISKFFKPAKDPAVAGQYKGIRVGINIDGKARYNDYSELTTFPQRMQIMVSPEAWFLKAEASLKGWSNAGDAKTNYETGISRSFEMHGLADAAAAYISDATSKPKAYVDPKSMNPGENDIAANSPYLSTITIKWDESDNNDRKLERIITQKWISLYPDGEEAWAEYRRTGYPIQFPVIVNNSAGNIKTIPGVRRITIPIREYNTNKAAAQAAAQMLGGPDTGGTRLWWDVENKSFR